MIRSILFALLCCTLCLTNAMDASSANAQTGKPPNVVLILADDLGYGDLSCYGQTKFQTPHIDRLAQQGLQFKQFYAGSTVCAPSRCVLMTGLDTGHCFIRGNSKDNLRPSDRIIPEMMREQGYQCGLFGKWGLGQEDSPGIPTKKGFHTFYGYLDQVHAHNFFPPFLIRDAQREPLRNLLPVPSLDGSGVATGKLDYAPDLILAEAKSFVKANSHQPFFLFLSINMPHANNEAKERGMEEVGFGPFDKEAWPDSEKGFAENVRRLDLAVGEIVDLIDAQGLRDNTLVLFTSDNGPHHEGGHSDRFFQSAGPLQGSKRDLLEGGIRVPMLARWPGRIEANQTTEHVGSFQDIFPTLAEITDGDGLPNQPGTGISFAPTLFHSQQNPTKQPQHEYLYWSFYEGGMGQAIRQGRWKAIEQPMGSPMRLYDLEADISESNDLSDKNPEQVKTMLDLMQRAYVPGEGKWQLTKKNS